MQVLFVCTANICRSAYASAAATSIARKCGLDSLEFSSAGTHAVTGRPMEDAMARVAVANGHEVAEHRSVRLKGLVIDSADLLITMENKHRMVILDERASAIRRTFVIGQLDRMLAAEEDLFAVRIEDLRSRLLPPMPTDAIKDPFRKGDQAAESVAWQIEHLLISLMPALAVMSANIASPFQDMDTLSR